MLGFLHGEILLGSEGIKPKNDSEGIRMIVITDLVRLSAHHLPLKSIFKQLAAAFLPGVIRRSYDNTKYLTDGLEYGGDGRRSSAPWCSIPGCIWEMGGWTSPDSVWMSTRSLQSRQLAPSGMGSD